MLRKYLNTGSRNPLRDKIGSFAGFAWLAIGVAACLAVFFYIEYQFSSDSYINREATLYRIDIESELNGRTTRIALTPAPLGPFMASRLPQAERVTRLYAPAVLTTMGNPVLKNGEQILRARRFIFVDPDFLDVFPFELIRGNPKTVLDKPFSVILTKDAAKKLFGMEDPMGKTILYNNKFHFTVTGVVENPPSYSAVEFDCLGSMKSLPDVTGESDVMTNGHKFDCYTYILFRKNTNVEEVDRQIQRDGSGFWDPVVRGTAGSPTIVFEPLRARR